MEDNMGHQPKDRDWAKADEMNKVIGVIGK